MGVSKNRGNYHQIINSNRVFPEKLHPYWGGKTPIFGSMECKNHLHFTIEINEIHGSVNTLPETNSKFAPENRPPQ